MESPEVKVFENDDDAYEQWVGQHGGYVLIERSRKPEYMLHDSDCGHLGKGDDDLKLTAKPRRWSKSRHTLVDWAVHETGERPLLCQSCM